MNESTILGAMEPELAERATSRRDLFRGLGRTLALAAAPVAAAVVAKQAFGQTLPANIVSVLNFALTLEELENEFYVRGLAAANLIPAADRTIFQTIQAHEAAHVQALRGLLGSQAVAKPTFDFTGGNGANNGPFAPFTNYAVFLVLSQGFEDLGVRAYKGQAPALISNDAILTAALTIHSVEARHASEVRRLRGEKLSNREQAPNKGWINDDDVDAAASAIQAIYQAGNGTPSEGNTTQAGIALTGLSGVTSLAASESFDEPLDMAKVLQIADPFIAG